MISGMHSSVSSHLSNYFKDLAKFDPKKVDIKNIPTIPNEFLYYEMVGRHPDRIRNLFFAGYILLRAFNRYYPYIKDLPVKTGNYIDD